MRRRFSPADHVHRAGTPALASNPIARPTAAGTVGLPDSSTRFGSRAEDGCGNDAAMEITERFPPPLGNLAKNTRFPHSHSRFSFIDHKNKDKNTNPAHTTPGRDPQEGTRLSTGC